MPVDRKLYNRYITKEETPAWLCPTCKAGYLRLNGKSLNTSLVSESEQASPQEWFDPEHSKLRFVAIFKCDNAGCKEATSVAGRGEVEMWPNNMGEAEYVEVLFPTYVNPSPSLITLPLRCPTAVVEELKKSFTASWGDFQSSGNHIRTAVEFILDSLNIEKTEKKYQRNYKISHPKPTY